MKRTTEVKERARHIFRLLEAEVAANRLILPSLPEVALRVRTLTTMDSTTFAELEREISRDAGIAARVMKVANSSLLRRGVPITSLKQAVACLGMNLVRSLVTQLAVLQTMQSGGGNRERLRGFVAGGVHISALCHCLAEPFPHLDAELAALGGLLHDIGKLPLREFLQRQPELSPLERLQFELMLHPHVGAMLLRHWQMPDELVQMARWHESILRETGNPQPDYVDLVIAANLLHYGTQKGRYARYAGIDIPAAGKVANAGHRVNDQNGAQLRVELMQVLVSG